MPAKIVPGRNALKTISGRNAAFGRKPSQVHRQRFSVREKYRFFVPTLRIQVTGKTKIRRLRREIYARDKTFAALMRRRERK